MDNGSRQFRKTLKCWTVDSKPLRREVKTKRLVGEKENEWTGSPLRYFFKVGKGGYLSKMIKKIGGFGQTGVISKLLFQRSDVMTRVKH